MFLNFYFRFLGALAIICLLAWTFVSAPAHGHNNDNDHHEASFIIADTKAKEFLDFEDKEIEGNKKSEENEIDQPAAPKKSSTKRTIENPISNIKRRENVLNGVVLPQSVDAFDVVGGADLFANHPNSIVDDEFLADERKIVPGLGEMGQPVSLSGEEADLAAELMKKEAFNIIASDKVTKNGLQKNKKNNSLNLMATENTKRS